MPQSDLFGLEMLWKLESANLADKADAMMLFVHWFLVRNGFRNVGVGDDKTLNNAVDQSELLPEGWNGNNKSYALRYIMNNELYILHGTLSNDTMIVNLLQAQSLQVSNAAFNLDKTITSFNDSNLTNVVVSIDDQITRLQTELIKPLCDGGSKSSSTQTLISSSPSPAQVNVVPAGGPRRIQVLRPSGLLLPFGGGGVGRGDLNPLGGVVGGGGGGGMLMDPMNMGPGRVDPFLPGARIDPMGPFPPRVQRPNPNPDHLPPPGYDDMFM
ncbi:AGAP007418-PA [Anopheles gambiae str. PEST]|uniref:Proteasome inhibitor PI31 subunit n=1 Tax=Anopheles gambiae TaxID=7165 RepID=Q7QJC6_ANOGA|nr:AGAP007418-PA [Anopheles gambiae str. PEST]